MLKRNRIAATSLYLIAALTTSLAGVQAVAAEANGASAGAILLATEGAHPSDALITAKIKAELLKANLMTGLDVKVSTHDGVVQLGGFVDRAEQVSQADDIANGVDGVQRVQNDLRIK